MRAQSKIRVFPICVITREILFGAIENFSRAKLGPRATYSPSLIYGLKPREVVEKEISPLKPSKRADGLQFTLRYGRLRVGF